MFARDLRENKQACIHSQMDSENQLLSACALFLVLTLFPSVEPQCAPRPSSCANRLTFVEVPRGPPHQEKALGTNCLLLPLLARFRAVFVQFELWCPKNATFRS